MKRAMDIYESFKNDLEQPQGTSPGSQCEDRYQKMFNELCERYIDDRPEQVTVVSTMKVNAANIKRFELIVSAMYRDVETKGVECFVSLLRPTRGELTYIAMTTYANIDCLKKAQGFFIEREEFTELLPIRDSLLVEPQRYQLTFGASFLMDAAGLVASLTSNRASIHSFREKLAKEVLTSSCKIKRVNLPIEASYISPFATRYFRNNKKGGHKNLRCFPGCRDGNHRELGYCGNSVKVGVVMPGYSCVEGANNAIISFCRFVLYSEEAHDIESSGPRILIGDSIAESDLRVLVRDQSNQLAPWVKGFPLEPSNGADDISPKVFEFNGDGISWHYGWKAPRRQSKFISKPEHSLEVLFFQYDGNKLKCLHILRSPSFSVDCSRRKYHRGETGIEIAVSSAKRLCKQENLPCSGVDSMVSVSSEDSEISSPSPSSINRNELDTSGGNTSCYAINLEPNKCNHPLEASYLMKDMTNEEGIGHMFRKCAKQQERIRENLIRLCNQNAMTTTIRRKGRNYYTLPNNMLKHENEQLKNKAYSSNPKGAFDLYTSLGHSKTQEELGNDRFARMYYNKGYSRGTVGSCHSGQFSIGPSEPYILPEEWDDCAVILGSLPPQVFDDNQNDARI